MIWPFFSYLHGMCLEEFFEFWFRENLKVDFFGKIQSSMLILCIVIWFQVLHKVRNCNFWNLGVLCWTVQKIPYSNVHVLHCTVPVLCVWILGVSLTDFGGPDLPPTLITPQRGFIGVEGSEGSASTLLLHIIPQRELCSLVWGGESMGALPPNLPSGELFSWGVW